MVESLHAKFNFYLPKHSTTTQNFLECLTIVFLGDSFKSENIKRYDIKSKAILNIIKDYKLYENFIWIKTETFKEYEKNYVFLMKKILKK